MVVDPSHPRSARVFHLRGNFVPEAFATNDRELFMIEYIPALAPDRYQVRRLIFRNGAVRPIGRRKLAAPEQMRGTGRMQVLGPGGKQLYTLYTQQGPNYSHGDTSTHYEAQGYAFVHVLNLQHGWAHCIDLPHPFGMGTATASALDVSRDGRRLFVSDWTNDEVAEIDTRRLRVRSTTSPVLGDADDATFAETSGDGSLYLAGNDQVVVMHTDTMNVSQRWNFADEVTGLAVSSDGRWLYVGQKDAIAVVDRVSGREQLRVPVPDILAIEHVIG